MACAQKALQYASSSEHPNVKLHNLTNYSNMQITNTYCAVMMLAITQTDLLLLINCCRKIKVSGADHHQQLQNINPFSDSPTEFPSTHCAQPSNNVSCRVPSHNCSSNASVCPTLHLVNENMTYSVRQYSTARYTF